MGNIKRFNSHSDYETWKATDGWDYPNVSFVDSSTEQALYYNNEFIMRWYDADNAKTPTFLGDISHDTFKAWVDSASRPCEISKSGTDFAYLNTSDLTKTTDGSDSHYGEDYPDFLQFAEIENINVGLFQNSKEGWKEVRFNFDLGCPKGFHKWFAHPYYNSTLGKYTKLMGRYNIIPVDTVSNVGTYGVTCNAGFNMSPDTGSGTTYDKGNWSANAMLTGIKATLDSSATEAGYELLEITYWEHLVMSYIFAAYHKTFDTQSIVKGLQSDYSNYDGNIKNGVIDTAETLVLGSKDSHWAVSNAANTSNQYYKFLWLDMPLHGQQWIWGAGFVANSSVSPGQYWMTFDDKVANLSATMAKTNGEVIGQYPVSLNSSYIKNMDLFGIPTAGGGSSSTGFYDGCWTTNLYDSRVAYLGGASDHGAVAGSWARALTDDASYAAWYRRGRLTMIR
jgi:hypothetical protein